MRQRTSLVNGIKIDAISEASHLQIGDTNEIHATTVNFAAQQLQPVFVMGMGDRFFEEFKQHQIPFPQFQDEVMMTTFHENPFIKVDVVRSLAIAVSGVIHIGNIRHMEGQSRVHHFRQLPKEEKE